MDVETHITPSGSFWYVVNDCAGAPLIVSPAIYGTGDAALEAGEAMVRHLAGIYARRTGEAVRGVA
ncbi:protein of unknown function [Magnetospirillum sp. XM-1]|uniref:hypothetical protein n=1 Tax=Magnetospirillum sp. XM-1 TaxID=1663591 RepID=UPI00073DE8C7|nr:hypothetical protein [Magnetospirillum sp. XM-1]CUW38806.1 protein of unknown function [Magnetospirillum sp. XM-1]